MVSLPRYKKTARRRASRLTRVIPSPVCKLLRKLPSRLRRAVHESEDQSNQSLLEHEKRNQAYRT
jgi:hypothetical protein